MIKKISYARDESHIGRSWELGKRPRKIHGVSFSFYSSVGSPFPVTRNQRGEVENDTKRSLSFTFARTDRFDIVDKI